jgi:caspase domain-containing protein
MAGRLGTVKSLVLGLVIVVSGLIALSWASHAETWRERRAKTAQGASPVVLPKVQPQPQTRPARVRDQAPVSCGSNERWSAKRGACVCASNMKREGDACVADEPVTAVRDPDAVPPPPPSAAPTPEQVEAIARSQKCLADLGYYKGEVDGKRGKETWTAFWNFKQDHGLKSYSDLLAEPVQQKLTELCQQRAEEAAKAAILADPLYQPEGDEALAVEEPDSATEEVTMATPETGGEEAPAPEPKARLDLDCLPETLIAVLRRAHGLGVAVKACERACLPPPKGFTPAQLDELQVDNGVVWCRACVPIDGNLALDDVRRIERAGNVEICPTPARQVARYGEGITDGLRSYMRVRELYRALPAAAEDPEAVAVVIGNRSYDKLPRSVTSYNDADAVYSFLTEHLGYRPDNIIDVRDAKKADFDRVFGAQPGFEGELARLVQSQPNSKVLIYYSGHGATDGAQSETYLVPANAEPYREESTGYKLSTLYTNLAALDAKSVLVLLETEFGEDHGVHVLPPNLPEMKLSALPRAPLPALTVLVAADRGQRTLVDMTYDIGLFTRYAIEGMAGSADLAPVGDGDGEVDSAELYAFTAAFVDLAARKTFGLLQQPAFSGAATSVVTSARGAPSGPE